MKLSASLAVSVDDRLELGALAPKPKPHVSCSLNALKESYIGDLWGYYWDD